MAEVINELIEFVRENELSVFNRTKTTIRQGSGSIFKTVDAKTIYNKVISKISQNFSFAETNNLFQYFGFTENIQEIKRRQEFFRSVFSLGVGNNSFLKELRIPRGTWRPKYETLVVTENEETFIQLQKLSCPVKYITCYEDLQGLETCDVIQVVDCENLSRALESLPQTVFLNSLDEVYLERYIEILSGWKDNLLILEKNETNSEIKKIVGEIIPLLGFLEKKDMRNISKEYVEQIIGGVNENILEEVKKMTLTGSSLVEILSRKLPVELNEMIEKELKKTNLPLEIFNISIPITLDERELEEFIRRQNSNEFTDSAEAVKRKAKQLIEVPEKLKHLEELVLVFDFLSGVYNFVKTIEAKNYPEESGDFILEKGKNILIEKPQPVSFFLNNESKCSILTGANSGGKTTLLEHIVQAISFFNLGLPVFAENIKLPVFSEVYYFAKNKGSMSKGAFETLLTQMSGIKPGKKTLILADEMEAVTEPGVAASIVCATAEYFINKDCFLVIATHLGQEIQKHLPLRARIDGIEAKGLDENNELIVDHNPVLGRLANSTPELIVERLANTQKSDYFNFLNEYIKR